jgi:hypothetical protein
MEPSGNHQTWANNDSISADRATVNIREQADGRKQTLWYALQLPFGRLPSPPENGHLSLGASAAFGVLCQP